MKKLKFREYYESKQRLLSACDSVPRIRTEYHLTKYCKFPVFESLDKDRKTYISFKPKDSIEILWEKVNEFDDYPTPKKITFNGENLYPCWNSLKVHKWVNSSTTEA